MSNPYPPTPLFGGAYNGYTFNDASLRDGGLHTYPPPPAGGPPAPQYRVGDYGPGMPMNTTLAPAMNNQSFQANATISNSTTLPAIPPPPFHVPSEFFKQFAHTSLPPPPYPPVPIPHLSFPQFPPPPPSFAPTSTPPNISLTNGSLLHPQNSQPAPRPLESPLYQQESFTITREEGELSDGDLNRSSQNSMVEASRAVTEEQMLLSVMSGKESSSNKRAYLAAVQPVTTNIDFQPTDSEFAIRQTANISQGTFSSADIMGNIFQSQRIVEDDRMPSADSDSISSYNPPSASTPDAGEIIGETVDAPMNGIQQSSSSMPSKGSPSDNATLVLREQVKDALRSLALQQIRYNELVGEGVDPHLLQNLYQELDPKNNSTAEKLSSPTSEVRPVVKNQEIALQNQQPAKDLSRRSVHDSDTASNAKNTDSSLATSKSTIDTLLSPKLADPVKPSIAVTVATEKAPIGPPQSTSSNVAMERKDRIAQLLAAKTGKTILPRIISGKEANAQTESPKTSLVVETAEKPALVPEKPSSPLLEPMAKPKNKAQTELIRQKMEALRKEALAKSQAQATINSSSDDSSPAIIPPTIAAQSRNLPSVEVAIEDTSSEPKSQIPGLFMTNEPYTADFGNPKLKTEDIQTEKVDDPTSAKSSASPVSQGTPAEVITDSTSSQGGHILQVRVPQKRPLASDSFEELMPSLKRPFGQKTSYDKVEIVLSDLESEEGEVEDVEMELDEESDEEKQPPLDVAIPVISRRDIGIRNLPPLTDIPSPKSISHIASGVATPTSTAAQTPGREKDKEDLWKAKHQEIELMRRKIAEMEERRKAKQSAIRAVSPKVAAKTSVQVIRTSLARPSQSFSPGLPRPEVGPKSEGSPGALPSPVAIASNPAELPKTPSAPSHDIKESLRAEDLRQQLLRRKTPREGTPGAAELELRRAQLAEKRQTLAALKREAERREAEIIEEARLLEAQLQGELNSQETYEHPPSNPSNGEEDCFNAVDKNVLASVSRKSASPEGTNLGSPSTATGVGLSSLPERASVEGTSRDVRTDTDVVLGHSDEHRDVAKLMATEQELGDLNSEIRDQDELHKQSHGILADDGLEIGRSRTSNDSGCDVPDAGIGSSFPLVLEEENSMNDDHFHAAEFDLANEDGSISMSDSNSDDYEPAEPDQMDEEQLDDRSENYEPAYIPDFEATAEVSALKQTEAMNHFASNGFLADRPQHSSNPGGEVLHQDVWFDDSEDGMQLTEPGIIQQPQIRSRSHDDEADDKGQKLMSHFKPYKTPRTYFKNFRYDDSFPETVSSGYKSLTFSNNIDPRKPFCPTELAGQTCEDPMCGEQHFQQVELTDDKILAQMSTANTLKTKAEHERWVAGLRQVIADLRSRGVKDFHMVASALAAYRRRFAEELSTPASSAAAAAAASSQS